MVTNLCGIPFLHLWFPELGCGKSNTPNLLSYFVVSLFFFVFVSFLFPMDRDWLISAFFVYYFLLSKGNSSFTFGFCPEGKCICYFSK